MIGIWWWIAVGIDDGGGMEGGGISSESRPIPPSVIPMWDKLWLVGPPIMPFPLLCWMIPARLMVALVLWPSPLLLLFRWRMSRDVFDRTGFVTISTLTLAL